MNKKDTIIAVLDNVSGDGMLLTELRTALRDSGLRAPSGEPYSTQEISAVVGGPGNVGNTLVNEKRVKVVGPRKSRRYFTREH
jgi:hypothetical protein